MRIILSTLFLALSWALTAQWQGDTDKYTINGDSLHLNDSDAGSAYLSKTSDIIEDAIWEFRLQMDFNPSSSNYASIFLVSENANLSGNGYYVKLGNTSDEVSLYRQDGENSTEIIDGLDNRVDLSKVDIKIKVSRQNGEWFLYSDADNSGYVLEGNVKDETYLTSSYFGVKSNYTSTRSDKFIYSDFSISGTAFRDNVAPRLDSVIALTKYKCRFYFNERVNVNSIAYQSEEALSKLVDKKTVISTFASPFAENDSSLITFSVADTSDNALSGSAKIYYTPYVVSFAQLLSPDTLTFTLNKESNSVTAQNILLNGENPSSLYKENNNYYAGFSSSVDNPSSNDLFIKDILDIYGDTLKTYQTELSWFIPKEGDIVFNELMPDPSPVLNILPNSEYIELYNNSPFPIQMKDWYFQRNDNTYTFPEVIIESENYLLVVKSSDLDSFPSVSQKIGLSSFPSLLNSGMSLALKTSQNIRVDSIAYEEDWHSPEAKNGGYSLARISTTDPSEAYNFQSSCSPYGGTPGESNCDLPPALDSIKVLSSNSLALFFNENIISNYVKYNNTDASSIDIFNNIATVTFTQDFPERDTFTIAFSVKDNKENTFETTVKAYYIPFEVSAVSMEDSLHLYITLNKMAGSFETSHILLDGKNPLSVVYQSNKYLATFGEAVKNRTTVSLQISGVKDANMDLITPFSSTVTYFNAELGDVVFNEIMADPEPVVGSLPEAEYIEIYNNTGFDLSLEDWYILKEDDTTSFPAYQLSADEYLLIGSYSAMTAFDEEINTLIINTFPSLTNSGMSLQLMSKHGNLIDFIDYQKDWHSDNFKAAGGFSLERIDVNNPSQTDNWTSSNNDNGGTPGAENSVAGDNPDYTPPAVLHLYAMDNSWLMLEISEPIMKENFKNAGYFSVSDDRSVSTILPLGNMVLSTQAMLGLNAPMGDQTVYHITVEGIPDMSGNLSEKSEHQVAICRLPDSNEVIINEIMCYPLSDQAEYVEIFNKTDVPFDLSKMQITQRDQDGAWETGKALADLPRILEPYSFMVITDEAELLQKQYDIEDEKMIEISSLPSLGNEEGNVAIIVDNATLLDEVSYSDEWHSPLLNDERGVALERINPSLTSNEASNWFSASALDNYGTPGKINSQYKAQTAPSNEEKKISVEPEVFTPDGDGSDDYMTLAIADEYEGGSIRVQIFNQRGIVVRELINNAIIGSSSAIHWDGTDSSGSRSPMGPYIMWVEIITTSGDVVTEKLEVVVSARVN